MLQEIYQIWGESWQMQMDGSFLKKFNSRWLICNLTELDSFNLSSPIKVNKIHLTNTLRRDFQRSIKYSELLPSLCFRFEIWDGWGEFT